MVNPNRRPERPQPPKQRNQGTQQNRPRPQQPLNNGGQPPQNLGGNGGNNNQPPSPWLNPDDEPKPDQAASFVEYLRWMRPADHQYKDATKTQILQMASEGKKYDHHLKTLNDRTKLIAGNQNTFEVTCPWRIRVGGHRGPESILLPAFDALGIPYIPSSTLRGVARTQAIRQIMAAKNCDWKTAEKDSQLVRHFGSLDASAENQAGKIVFLDAYPIAGKFNLEMDMANNIWSWDGGKLNYSPNPNPFLSLEKTAFLIGLRLISGCEDQQLLKQVQDWLIAGLANGTGSQINTGYGQLVSTSQKSSENEFLKVKFSLEGQLIHGYQKPGQWNWNDRRNEWQMRGNNQAEVRPTAFKSMLRYWFRVFALGVISPADVQTWEGKIFGAITPTQSHGYLRVNICDGRVTKKEAKGKTDPCGAMAGTLSFSFSPEVPTNNDQIQDLIKNLTWLMFNLGGIGQGARRPSYSRANRQYAPWWRGSTFYLESDPWKDPEEATAQEFAKLFKRRLRGFYSALSQCLGRNINPETLQNIGQVNEFTWQEAADQHCRIVIASGNEDFGKPFALAQLHHQRFKVQGRNGLDYNGNLCGQVGGRGGVKPSPVWIADLGDYQIVTIFGATASPRRDYLQSLNRAIQVFPFK